MADRPVSIYAVLGLPILSPWTLSRRRQLQSSQCGKPFSGADLPIPYSSIAPPHTLFPRTPSFQDVVTLLPFASLAHAPSHTLSSVFLPTPHSIIVPHQGGSAFFHPTPTRSRSRHLVIVIHNSRVDGVSSHSIVPEPQGAVQGDGQLDRRGRRSLPCTGCAVAGLRRGHGGAALPASALRQPFLEFRQGHCEGCKGQMRGQGVSQGRVIEAQRSAPGTGSGEREVLMSLPTM